VTDATRHSDQAASGGARQPGAAPRILFACGGTGGHVYPAIAIADEVRQIAPDAAIVFAGTRDRMEWEAVPKAGYEIQPVTVSGFQRGFSGPALRRNASFPFKLTKGLLDSLRLVGRFRPDVVVGTGGYVAGPVGLAAALRRTPLVLQEQNAYAGATNKLLARFASRVFVAFEAAVEYFPAGRTLLAGNPVRRDLATVDTAAARAHFGLEDGQTALLAMGGSLGAAPINEALRANLDTLLAREDLVVIWQTGSRFFDELRQRVPDHPRLRLLAYLDRMDYAYAAADVAVCRAGAITCSELALTGTPSILVPSPNVTADHQTKNARAMADAGAAILLPEARLAARLPQTLASLLDDGDAPAGERQQMAAAARAMARPDASRTIAEAVLALANERRGR
jgi:UDP-N-acetylglucosamine--N-acetylmuramyl-(pentapeptide) pyrophosphoryl-undecaprenol N-acetylglucosamine transferase